MERDASFCGDKGVTGGGQKSDKYPSVGITNWKCGECEKCENQLYRFNKIQNVEVSPSILQDKLPEAMPKVQKLENKNYYSFTINSSILESA